MSKNVDLEKPLSDEDRAYLHSRAAGWQVEENDRRFKKGKFAEDHEEEFKQDYTVAGSFTEPGSEADAPPAFVGVRPYGVDRGVWAGSTGVAEEDVDNGPNTRPSNPDDFKNMPALANPESTTAANDAEEADEVETVDIDDLDVDELKAELSHRGLKVSGNKAELKARLQEDLDK